MKKFINRIRKHFVKNQSSHHAQAFSTQCNYSNDYYQDKLCSRIQGN